jgi:hypothetical protein
MPQPTPNAVHVDAPLTQISVAFLQDANNFIAGQVFPTIPVAKQSDRYYTYDRGFFNRDEMEVRAPGTESKGVAYEVDNTPTYYAPIYAAHHDIADEVRANADSVLDLNREAAELLTHKALIKREKLWSNTFFAGSVWTNDYDGVSGAPGANQVKHWSDAASTPIEDVRFANTTLMQETGRAGNTLVLGREVADKLLDHPDIIDRIKYGQTPGAPAMAGTAALAALFGVERVLVMNSIENTAAEGATNSHAFIGGKKALLCYAAPNPGIMTPSAGYTFAWNGYMGAAGAGQRVSRFRMDHLRSDRIELEMAFDQKLVSADLGFFWDSVVA